MTRTRAPLRATGVVAVLACAALLAAGCGRDDEATTAAGATGPPRVTVADPTPDELPPGDPGPDAPAAEDPGAPTESPRAEPARTVVPAEALLGADSVGDALGGTWRPVPAAADSCASPRPAGAVAVGTRAFGSDPLGLVETVATHASPDAARTAVAALVERLRGCGWTPAEASPLGEVSARLNRSGGKEAVSVFAAEGVTVTLVGTGGVATDADRWDALADVALSSSCPAAPDGCH
jgi:hypothetical protein